MFMFMFMSRLHSELLSDSRVSVLTFQLGVTTKLQQVDLIAELKKKQVSPQVREGKDGTIEDIITGTPASTTSPRPQLL